MIALRRMSLPVTCMLCCLVLFAAVPITTATQESSARDQIAADSNGQSVSTCFTGGGHAFTIGSEEGTHIWVRLHAAMLTDSGGSVGAELVGSTGGSSIIEVMAGFNYVGDGFLDLLTSPTDAFDLVHGYGFQIPVLDIGPETENGASSDAATTHSSDDSPFEILRC